LIAGTEQAETGGRSCAAKIDFRLTLPRHRSVVAYERQEFAVAEAVRETLWLSACGGGRGLPTWADPQYQYVLKQGEVGKCTAMIWSWRNFIA
jgi:hypothetical protein